LLWAKVDFNGTTPYLAGGYGVTNLQRASGSSVGVLWISFAGHDLHNCAIVISTERIPGASIDIDGYESPDTVQVSGHDSGQLLDAYVNLIAACP
jgi:hypothetical protein